MTQAKTPKTTPTTEPTVSVAYPTNSEMVQYVLDTFLKALMHTQSQSHEAALKLGTFNEAISPSYNIGTIFSAETLALLSKEMLAVEGVINLVHDTMASFKLLLGNDYNYSDVIEWMSAAYGFVEVKQSDSLLPASVPEHVREALYPTINHVSKTLTSNPHIVYFVLLNLVS